MKYLKMLGLAAVAAMSFMAFAANTASATTLEVGGVTTNFPIRLTLSAEQTLTWARTDGTFLNTCTQSHFRVETLSTTNPVTGPIDTPLTFEKCTRPVTVIDQGSLELVHIGGTTDGTVFSEETELTTGSPFGTLTCKTGETTHIGTLTGVDGSPATHATIDISAVLNCGFLVPSATWKGAYLITSPHGLGVSA
ncbi:MAG TPA: hypothetical protein VFZ29_11250 [Solirubrobacterales bacterium]